MTDNDDQAAKNRTDALTVVAFGAASLFVAVGGYVFQQHGERITELEHRSLATEIIDTETREQLNAHVIASQHWISLIKETDARAHTLERRVDRLETKPDARPDAFTGQDGARLNEQVKENRVLLDENRAALQKLLKQNGN